MPDADGQDARWRRGRGCPCGPRAARPGRAAPGRRCRGRSGPAGLSTTRTPCTGGLDDARRQGRPRPSGRRLSGCGGPVLRRGAARPGRWRRGPCRSGSRARGVADAQPPAQLAADEAGGLRRAARVFCALGLARRARPRGRGRSAGRAVSSTRVTVTKPRRGSLSSEADACARPPRGSPRPAARSSSHHSISIC